MTAITDAHRHPLMQLAERRLSAPRIAVLRDGDMSRYDDYLRALALWHATWRHVQRIEAAADEQADHVPDTAKMVGAS